MQKTGLGLRTTIVVNIALVMFITMLLISFLVLTITRKTIFDYKIKSAENMITSLQNIILSSVNSTDEKRLPLQTVVDTYTETNLELTQLTIVDDAFRVLYDKDKRNVGSPYMDPHLSETFSTGTLVKKIKSYQGKDHLFLSAPFYQGDLLRGGLQVVLSLNDVEETMATFQHTLLVFTITTALAFILIGSLLLSRYLVKPLEKLIIATEDITEGYLPQPLETTGKNEIGTLSLSLTRMTDKLKDDKQEIENYIHSLEESNARLKRAQDDVIRSEKLSSVGRLAAGVAHEIGNPIGIILGYIEILRHSGNSQNEKADALSRLENEVMRIDTTIRELLSFSRPKSVNPHPIQLNTIVKDATSFIMHQKAFRSIQVKLALTEDLPWVLADEGQLQQVMVNLFLNAIDAMPQGGKLSVTTGPLYTEHKASFENDASPTGVSITVSDTGTGIQAEEVNKIFDPFYTTKSPGKGTGLGLSVCLSIVESFNGTLSVETTPGQGTVFTVVFPHVTVSQAAQA